MHIDSETLFASETITTLKINYTSSKKKKKNLHFFYTQAKRTLWFYWTFWLWNTQGRRLSICWFPKWTLSLWLSQVHMISTWNILLVKDWLKWSWLDSSVQFISVAHLCPTLCDPMNHSTPGLPVHHQLLGFTQTHVHRVVDGIQPSHPLLSPSPPAPNPSQHQGL